VSPKVITPASSLAASPPTVVALAPATKPPTACPPAVAPVRSPPLPVLESSPPAPMPTTDLVLLTLFVNTYINWAILDHCIT